MTKKVQLNFLITLLSQELPLIPNEVSSIVDEIRDLFVVLIQWNYFLCKFLSERAINVWPIVSLSPQKQHPSSALIPCLNGSFL